MTLILKSNIAFAGSADLGEVSAVTRSAADIYAAYEARVTADGGIIQDSTATLAAITAALAGGYFWPAAIAVSARWGIKLSGSQIVKFYNLIPDGVDGISQGTVDLDTTTEAYPTALFNLQAQDKISFTAVPLNVGGNIGFASSHRFTTTGMILDFTANAAVHSYRSYAGRLIVGGVTKIEATPDFATPSKSGVGIFVEQSVPRFTIFLDGLHRKVTTNSFTPIAVGATADMSYYMGISTASYGIELWYLNAATFAAMQNLSLTLGDLY